MKIDVSDLILIAGIALLLTGCYMFSLALCLSVAGVLLISYAAILTRAQTLQAGTQEPTGTTRRA